MNRNNFGRFIIVLLILVWSLYNLYPPSARDLVKYFSERAVGRDATFAQIVEQARALQKTKPGQEYEVLRAAIGTNDITRYFPFYRATDEIEPTKFVLNRLQREAAGRIRLGLDLQGGTSFLVKMDTSALTNTSDASSALSQAVEVLRKRVDRFGVAEPVIQPAGANTILIQLPGLSGADQETARNTIQKAAFLEFRLVSPTSDEDIRDGVIPPGHEVLRQKRTDPAGRETIETVVVKKKAEMTGSSIKSAMVTRGNLGEPEINFTLNSEGAAKFGEITKANIGRRLAIILDGQLYSAPVIRSEIATGSGQITGQFDTREAFELANVLENPLRAPLKIESSSQVDPTLGKDSIRSGIKACVYGTLAVAIFMLVYYMFAGLVANVALIANIIILLGVMASIGTTLTLPGIAGIVLTVGMAVDANVLIYERIREEKDKGKSLRGAIDAGYSRAFGTIFDSNVTTLISSVILIVMGTGPIKGFGVALTIGVTASMFTSLVVTRLIFDFMLARGMIKSINMLHIIKAVKIDFLKIAKPAFALSWMLILLGVAYGLYRGKSAFGIDFIGGETTDFAFTKKISEEQVRAALERAGVGDPVIQYQRDMSSGRETLRVDAGAGTSDKVMAALKEFSDSKYEVLRRDFIGPIVGKEIQRSATIAGLLALFGILVYVAFRYEFSFAIGAVIAIVHDILMTVGWYFLSGREFNATTVAALLTIIGFSINDTIVIFDRIREDLKLGVRGSFRDVINQALNQTLSRTIITSGTVFLATLSLYLFGGGAINDFAFAFLVGILTGTYSSIYIASAIVLWLNKGQRPQLGAGPVEVTAGAPARA